MDRRIIRDEQWDRIKDLLPGKAGDRGAKAKDNRLFLEAVLWIGRVGGPWRDLPRTWATGTPRSRALRDGPRRGSGRACSKRLAATGTWKK